MNRQERYRQEYKRLRPEWQDSLSIYKDLIDKATTRTSYILDVGCGHGDYLRSVFEKTKHTYGIDPDKSALSKNTFIKHLSVASVEKLPFKDNFFDVVVLQWVLEHLPDPETAFSEIHRVLKPGGKVIFVTPNARNYNAWIIRLIPNRFHGFFTNMLYGRKAEDAYPVQYKVNSYKKLAKILEPIGLNKSQLIFNGDPSYISFNTPLFALARGLERITDLKPLQPNRVQLIGMYEKSKS